MLTLFRTRLFRLRFACSRHANAIKIVARLRWPLTLRILSRPKLALAASLFLGTLNPFLLSARGQNAEPSPTSSEPPLPAGEISRPSREVQVETNANPVNENFRRFRYNLGVTVREVYDDNINISSFQRISDFYTVIERGIQLSDLRLHRQCLLLRRANSTQYR